MKTEQEIKDKIAYANKLLNKEIDNLYSKQHLEGFLRALEWILNTDK